MGHDSPRWERHLCLASAQGLGGPGPEDPDVTEEAAALAALTASTTTTQLLTTEARDLSLSRHRAQKDDPLKNPSVFLCPMQVLNSRTVLPSRITGSACCL